MIMQTITVFEKGISVQGNLEKRMPIKPWVFKAAASPMISGMQ
jgi:hypothetical protein